MLKGEQMEHTPLISIVVPIYNVEVYLEKCITSILKQTYQNIEVILVDDGSNDHCPSLCNIYAKKDSRIIVIHQKNSGLSDARNSGVSLATGEYIGFVDSDDWIDEDMYETLVTIAQLYHADVAEISMRYIYDNSIIEKQSFQTNVLTPFEATSSFLDRTIDIKGNVCNKLYRKEIVKQIPFPSKRLHEDAYFTYKALYYSHIFVRFDICKYNYLQNRKTSIMSSPIRPQNIYDAITAFEERNQFFKSASEKVLYEKSKAFYYQALFSYYRIAKKYLPKEKILRNELKEKLCLSYPEIKSNPYLGPWKWKYLIYKTCFFIK